MKILSMSVSVLFAVLGVAHAATPTKEMIIANFELEAPAGLRASISGFFWNGKQPKPGDTCSFEWAAAEIDELLRGVKTGNSYIAITKGRAFAATAAACGNYAQTHPELGEYSNLGLWARYVGVGLYAGDMMLMPGEAVPGDFDRPIAYFEYAQSVGAGNNQQFIDQLKKLKAKHRFK